MPDRISSATAAKYIFRLPGQAERRLRCLASSRALKKILSARLTRRANQRLIAVLAVDCIGPHRKPAAGFSLASRLGRSCFNSSKPWPHVSSNWFTNSKDLLKGRRVRCHMPFASITQLLRPSAGDNTVEGCEQGIDLGCPAVQFLGDQQPVRRVVLPKREFVDFASVSHSSRQRRRSRLAPMSN